MIRSFKYRLYVTKEQDIVLDKQLEEARALYNLLLEASIKAYKEDNKSLLGYKLNELSLRLRKEKGLSISAQSSQEIAGRITKAFKNFFRRLNEGKRGNSLGYPRFKANRRYESITFPQYPHCFKLLDEDTLSIWNVGISRIKYLKDINGKIKTLTLKKEPTGNWYAVIICDGITGKRKAPTEDKAIGIDVGLTSLITTSEGTVVNNPHFLKKAETILIRRDKQLSKKMKRSKNRYKAILKLAKAYRKTTRRRETFLHNLTSKLISEYKIIALEKLNVVGLAKNHRLSKQILDVRWSEFVRQLIYKAEEAGSIILQVDPRNTSKKCSKCGWKDEDQTLADRMFKCENCGLELDRDINAARNILKTGLNTLGRREINACGDETSVLEKTKARLVVEARKNEKRPVGRFRSY